MYLFIFCYYILVSLAHFCALPILFLLSFKPKYKHSLKRRFFIPEFLKETADIYWIHACSFGEIKALQPLVESLEKTLKDNEKILLTTTTQTGFALAKESYSKCIVHYLPFESFIPFWMWNLSLKMLVLFEAEFWFMPVFCAKKKGAKTFLINARISSFKKYQKGIFFYKRFFYYIDKVFCQKKEDKRNFEALGAKDVEVYGNLKLYIKPQVTQQYSAPNQKIWVIASTHQKDSVLEEVLILEALLKVLPKNLKSCPRILFVPRHLERIKGIQQALDAILKSHNLPNLVLASEVGIEKSLHSPFVLIDKMGVLNNLYALAELVILGGSFLKGIGGHNPVEPAFFKIKLISGPYIFHQRALFNCIQNYVLCDISQLGDVLLQVDCLYPSCIVKKIKIAKIIQALRGVNENS
ncbi:lipid IV(A) 3-deoxy-D-manno-octulosonic acid transferase [Helicobacter mesocricetorum]|uniref:lipid IV(A) 3-deoxy-D-manno-octulosonic acid transferase n=1 Tax=Helicobacter mesocricetorum TaxID=87012 RepID=UPI000CF19911|nr:lipid IV(A) 3-deoxy-D-manno-octulosonic acid transferase [Helicobacter mesocricetorum]